MQRASGAAVINYYLSVCLRQINYEKQIQLPKHFQCVRYIQSWRDSYSEDRGWCSFCHHGADVTMVSFVLDLGRVWSTYFVMIQMCLSYLGIGWIGQKCIARCKWSAGMDQYFTLIYATCADLCQNACIYQVCIHSAVVIQPPTFTTKNCLWQGTDLDLERISTCHLCWSWSELLASTRYAYTQPLWYNLLPIRQRIVMARYRWSPGMDQ